VTSDSSFAKSRRLLNAKAYQAVFDHVDWKVSNKYLLCLTRDNGLNHPRLGLVIAKKNVRLAVQRNRVKRIIRESFRLHQQQLPNIDVIVLARAHIDQLDNQQVAKQIEQCWDKLIKKVNNPK
jgi:ribonuclease P protein component